MNVSRTHIDIIQNHFFCVQIDIKLEPICVDLAYKNTIRKSVQPIIYILTEKERSSIIV